MITFKAYRKKSGEIMLYINGTNGCSIGLSFETYSAPSRGMTKGKRCLVDHALQTFDARSTPFSGSRDGFTNCGGLFEIDPTGSYIVRHGRALNCGTYYGSWKTEAVAA